MELGLIVMPNHPPERSPYDGSKWDLQVLSWADALGYREAWFGEHFTVKWEPHPAPDMLAAQALMVTDQIILASGAHLLPYHNPIELAHRVAFIDQLAKGRTIFGIGTGAFASDAALFGVSKAESQEMTLEALDIIEGLWRADQDRFEHKGKYWNIDYTNDNPDLTGLFIKPYQKPGPPIGMAGLSPGSSTLKLAGERGFIPLSLNLSHSYLASHWEAYEEGARAAGLVADRRKWRVSRDIFVAETDEEAMRLCVDGMMGRTYREFFIPFFKLGGLDKYMMPDPSQEMTVEWLAENAWLVGSPETVAEKLQEQYNAAGGWGVLNLQTWDYSDNPEAWHQCLELLATEVVPRLDLRDITPSGVAA